MQFRERRHPASGTVHLIFDGGRQVAYLLDVSSGGAKVSVEDDPPPRGAAVIFSASRHKVRARISWADNGEVGLQFVAPLDAAMIREIAGKPVHRGPDTRRKRWVYGSP